MHDGPQAEQFVYARFDVRVENPYTGQRVASTPCTVAMFMLTIIPMLGTCMRIPPMPIAAG